MPSIWAESVARGLDQALDLLASAVRDCTDGRWETSMWQVPPPAPGHRFIGPDWQPVTDSEQWQALARRSAERWATPWSVAWHALETLDYDLAGEFGPWSPPPPFAGHPHWRDIAQLPAAWTRSEVLAYVEYCRRRARDTLAQMTDERAEAPLPPAHRYRGQPHARIITGLIGHTSEHAAQIRQFVTTGPAAATMLSQDAGLAADTAAEQARGPLDSANPGKEKPDD
jgi:hypothetical protein